MKYSQSQKLRLATLNIAYVTLQIPRRIPCKYNSNGAQATACTKLTF